MSTKDLVLFGMSTNCRAALGVSTKSHRLLGMGTKSRVMCGANAKSPVLVFPLFRLRAKQYDTICRVPAKLCMLRATVRDLFAFLGIGPKSRDSVSFGP